MGQDTLWNECEDLDLDEALKRRVEALLADPTFLAWLDQQDDDGTCPFSRQARHNQTALQAGRTTPAWCQGATRRATRETSRRAARWSPAAR